MQNREALQTGDFGPATKQLGKLVKHVLSDAGKRAAFEKDPERAAKEYANLDPKDFDPKFAAIFSTLKNLSPEQLALLATLNEEWPLFVEQEVGSFHPLMVF